MKLQSQWVVGFVDRENCFFVDINENKTLTLKKQVLPEFVIVQHKKDVNILYTLKNFFKCGVVRVNHGNRMCLRIRGHTNLMQFVIPFFEKHKLKTKNRINFEKFRDIVLLMEKKQHLTLEGLIKIQQIKYTMNTSSIN